MQFPKLGRKEAFLMAQVKAECPESFSSFMQFTDMFWPIFIASFRRTEIIPSGRFCSNLELELELEARPKQKTYKLSQHYLKEYGYVLYVCYQY